MNRMVRRVEFGRLVLQIGGIGLLSCPQNAVKPKTVKTL